MTETGELCEFCLQTGDGRLAAPEHFGDGMSWVLYANDLVGPFEENRYVHRRCAIWSPRVFVSTKEPDKLQNVLSELKRASTIRCGGCGKRGASLGCWVKSCKRSYHLDCAIKEQCFLDHNDFKMVCAYCYLDSFRASSSGQPGMSAVDRHEAFMRTWSSSNSTSTRTPAKIPESINLDHVQIFGVDKALSSLKECIVLPLLYPEVMECVGLSPNKSPRGVILHGAPGVGKTLLIRSFLRMLTLMEPIDGKPPVSIFVRQGAEMLSRYYGETEKNLRDLFKEAQSVQPSVIVLEQIDAIAPIRSSRKNQVHSSIVTTLLSLMDGAHGRGNVFVLAATNRIQDVDPALRRPGRFDTEIYVPIPDAAAKKEILLGIIKPWKCRIGSDNLDVIIENCIGYTGADLRGLCNEAVLSAISRAFPGLVDEEEEVDVDVSLLNVRFKDFVSALEKINKRTFSKTSESLQIRNRFEQQYLNAMHMLNRESNPFVCLRLMVESGDSGLSQQMCRSLIESLDIPHVLTVRIYDDVWEKSAEISNLLDAHREYVHILYLPCLDELFESYIGPVLRMALSRLPHSRNRSRIIVLATSTVYEETHGFFTHSRIRL